MGNFEGQINTGRMFEAHPNYSGYTFQLGFSEEGLYTVDFTRAGKSLRVCKYIPQASHRVQGKYDLPAEKSSYFMTTEVLLDDPTKEWKIHILEEESREFGVIVNDETSSKLLISGELRGFLNGTGILNRGSIGALDLSRNPCIPKEMEVKESLRYMKPHQGKIYRAIILSALAADISKQASTR